MLFESLPVENTNCRYCRKVHRIQYRIQHTSRVAMGVLMKPFRRESERERAKYGVARGHGEMGRKLH